MKRTADKATKRTTLNRLMVLALMIVTLFVSSFACILATPGQAEAASAKVTWPSKPSYWCVNDYFYIEWKATASSNVKWTNAAGYIYDSTGTRVVAKCEEKCSISSKTLLISYNVKKEMKVALKPNTRYYVQYKAKAGGRWYTSPKFGFKGRTVEDRAINLFSKDNRFKNGVSWGDSKRPQYNTSYSSQGCCAYAADFLKFMYGQTNLNTAGSKYTSASNIKAGDIIHLKAIKKTKGNRTYTGWGHWMVVLQRNGNKLVTAEGNAYGGRVLVSSSKYYISGGKLCGCGEQASKEKNERGSKVMLQLAFDYGRRYY